MTTDLYDGTGSPNQTLEDLARLLDTTVISTLAWGLAVLLALVTLTSWRVRRKFHIVHTAPSFIGSVTAATLATSDLTERGDSGNAFVALVCLAMACITLFRAGWHSLQMLGFVGDEQHPGGPTIIGVNLLASPLWATIAATLLQNSMSGHWPEQIRWFHVAVLAGAGTLPVLLAAQAIYARNLAKYHTTSVWDGLRARIEVPAPEKSSSKEKPAS